MSRTTLCVITAAGLALASVVVMIGRYHILGGQVKVPVDPGTWKVSMLVQGRCTGSDAKLITAMPLELGHQHILRDDCRSNELWAKPPDAKYPHRHQVFWSQRS